MEGDRGRRHRLLLETGVLGRDWDRVDQPEVVVGVVVVEVVVGEEGGEGGGGRRDSRRLCWSLSSLSLRRWNLLSVILLLKLNLSAIVSTLLSILPPSALTTERSAKREARSAKREARSAKREARSAERSVARSAKRGASSGAWSVAKRGA